MLVLTGSPSSGLTAGTRAVWQRRSSHPDFPLPCRERHQEGFFLLKILIYNRSDHSHPADVSFSPYKGSLRGQRGVGWTPGSQSSVWAFSQRLPRFGAAQRLLPGVHQVAQGNGVAHGRQQGSRPRRWLLLFSAASSGHTQQVHACVSKLSSQ